MNVNPKEQSQRWLLHAETDLGYAKLGIELGGFYAQTCFMVHQSAEKALKALLFLRGARIVGERSLSEMVKRVADVSPGLNRYQDMADMLDKYYLASRYLGSLPGSDEPELFDEARAREAVGEGENLILEIRNIIRLAR